MAILPGRGYLHRGIYIHSFSRGKEKLIGSYILGLAVNMEMIRKR